MTTKLETKIEHALNETRTLVLGAQVLVGLQYRSVFEKRFPSLPRHAQYAKLGGLGLMLIGIALLMSPPAYHRIVEDGNNSARFHRFVTRVAELALIPFAFGLGIDFFVAAQRTHGTQVGILAGGLGLLIPLFFWYVLESLERRRLGRKEKRESTSQRTMETPLDEKIKHLLTEARMVLPGAQALLGFQFLSVLTEAFEELPKFSRALHLASLAAVGLTTVLLMAPAAYHRIVEEGEDTSRFHRIGSWFVLSAMATLALGIAGDTYVVVERVTRSTSTAIAAALAALAMFYGLWFGYTLLRRSVSRSASRARSG